MNYKEALDIFRLGEVPAKSRLKKLYRIKAKSAHPDHGGGIGDFLQLQEAFKVLDAIAVDKDVVLTTVDGILLSDLGNGLGPMKNGKECSHCEGNGYTRVEIGEHWEPCRHCDGSGYHQVLMCKSCGGRGYFINPKTEERVATCETCKGTGEYVLAHPVACKKCNPNGQGKLSAFEWSYFNMFGVFPMGHRRYIKGKIRVAEGIRYLRCDRCNGTGEVEMFNPVLPKGKLAAFTTRR